jgi:type II secretory pathway pseudopilin PulG
MFSLFVLNGFWPPDKSLERTRGRYGRRREQVRIASSKELLGGAMHRESGISLVAIVVVVAVLAAGGTAFFAWRNTAQLDRMQSELDIARSGLDKARAELRKAGLDLAAATKEAKDLKVATERLTGERDAVRTSMENEQATGVRLRAELALAKEQVSYLSARSSKDVVRGMPRTSASQ